jgi:hypothetical protein
VQRAGKDATHYFIHRDLYRTLALIRARTLMMDYRQPQIGPAGQGERFGGSIMGQSRAIEHRPASQQQLPPAGANEDNAQAESAHELRSRYVADLLGAMRVDAGAYELVSGPALGAAVAAKEAFTRVRRSNQALDRLLAARDEEAHESFTNARSFLLSRLKPHQSWEQQVLMGAIDEIDQNWPIVMLLPNGPYEAVLKETVEAMEADAGAGGLSTEEASLYEIARALADAFKNNGRSGELAWRRLEAAFDQAPRGGEPRIAFDDGSRTLN